LLHKPQFYQFHKRHHEYNQTVLTAVQYSHPIDYIVSSLVPFSAGFVFLALITNVHFVTVALWVIYRSYQTIIGHCGYDLVFDPGNLVPFCIGADHHDFHHANSSGNYGSLFMFWDALFGTQKDYVSWLRKKVEN
jgi:methylsterol monooxygenase